MNEQNIQVNSNTIERGHSKIDAEEATILHKLRKLEADWHEYGYKRGKAGQRELKPNDITFFMKVKIIADFILSNKKIPNKDLAEVIFFLNKLINTAYNKGCINGYQEFKAS